MYRAPIVLGATALGLAATLGFNTRHAESATTTTTSTTAAVAATPASSSSSTAKTTSKTVTSDSVSTPYGPVQLKVTFTDGKVTKIEPVSLPSNDPKSQEINAYAGPQLQASALSKKDGTVDAVSGATFTSNGYQAALQSALDKAGISTSTSTSS
jgi:uncharacterized protein with FMN-binding domain